ncbi:MAG TPA: T9SS type A sorting domain-containing protein [Ignavibacteria bacterium]
MKNLLLFSILLIMLMFSFNFTGRNDDDVIDARSQFPSGTFTASDFDLVPNDSCAVLNPEAHDDATHENGYLQVGDSSRWVQKLSPTTRPWTYTKICVGFTKTGATTSLTYDVVIYDSTATGPGNLLAIYPGQSISGIPQFPGMIWSSTVVNVPVTGAIYAGIRYDNNPNLSIYISVDQSAGTPQWPIYNATASPPVWALFTAAKALCVRAEGQPAGGGNPLYYTQWCPANTLPVIPTPSLYGSAAWLGDTLYYAQGSTDGTTASNVVYRFVWGGAWSTGRPLPLAKAIGTLTRVGTKLYFVGGGTPNTNGSTDVYQYDPTAGWTTMAPLPTAKSGHTAHNWGDSVLFIVGGPWSAQDANVYAYRPASNTWISSTPFIGPNRRSHGGGIVGNKILVGGGFPFTNTLVIGTIGSNAGTIGWAAGPPYPSVAKSRIGGVSAGDRFYLIGGNNSVGTTSSDSTFIYTVSANSWSILPSVKPTQSHNISNSVCARFFGDTVRIFSCGGTEGSVTSSTSFHLIGCGPLVGVTNISGTIPDGYVLSQNYPNPFNPTTNIKFSLPKAGNVKLVVFDILGREVTTLVNEFKTAGNYLVDFNALNLASGVYFYKITANDFTETKKMLLIK